MPSTSSSNKCIQDLLLLARQDWPILRDLYKQNWPEHITSYYTINNYIAWAEKIPQLQDVQIFTTDHEWRQHGTYILEDRNKLRYNVFFNTLSERNHARLLTALKCLPNDVAFTLAAYVEKLRPMVEQYLSDIGITNFGEGYCPTKLRYLPKEKCLKLELKPMPEFTFKPLTEEFVTQIDDLWPHQYPGSADFIRRVIRYNLSFGAYERNSGKLCAWVMQEQNGTIGLLQVEAAYQRRGLGEQLLRLLCIKMAELGMDATVTIMNTNIPSLHLSEKLGFKMIDGVYWFDKVALGV